MMFLGWQDCRTLDQKAVQPLNSRPTSSRLIDEVYMIVQRWEAPITPTKQQVERFYLSEGLEIFEETQQPSQGITEHRHPFCEVRTLLKGEMHFNIAGNRFILRAGDRVEIPANTRHQHTAQGEEACVCLVGYKAF